MKDTNVLEIMEELMSKGYSEEHAQEVAVYSNYDIPLEEIMDIN